MVVINISIYSTDENLMSPLHIFTCTVPLITNTNMVEGTVPAFIDNRKKKNKKTKDAQDFTSPSLYLFIAPLRGAQKWKGVVYFMNRSWELGVDRRILPEGHCQASRGLPSDARLWTWKTDILIYLSHWKGSFSCILYIISECGLWI